MLLKSPFEKGGLRGIYGGLKIPPQPPFAKGGSFKELPDEEWAELLGSTRPT